MECTVLRPVALIKIMLFGIITVNSAQKRGETTDTSVAEYKRSQDERLKRERPVHLSGSLVGTDGTYINMLAHQQH